MPSPNIETKDGSNEEKIELFDMDAVRHMMELQKVVQGELR